MTISRNIILDLLPMYLAGEVSEESRQLVEAYLEEHPEMKQLAQQDLEVKDMLPVALEPARGIEKRTFQRVRSTLRYRGLLLGMAIAYTIAPFSFVFHDSSVQWMLFRNNPGAAAVFIVTAVLLWAAYLVLYFRSRGAKL